MIARGSNFKSVPLNVVGSSVFGRYPKISIEKTFNMFISEQWLVPYPGYQTAISKLGTEGRALHSSTKLDRMIAVIDATVYLVNIFFDQNNLMTFDTSAIPIGTLETASGPVYIAENNKPQIAISDGVAIYIYDPTLTPQFQQVSGLNFVPGYIDFHDTYFLCAASEDTTYTPAADNTWRLSNQNDGTMWPSDAQHVGLLQTKPDNVQAVVRFPSKGNMIIVMGETVTEFWFDTGAQLFPYQRNNQMTIDYGCLSPATIATNDQIVVWLAANEKSGPIIMYTTGGLPERITTDGIDYLFSQLKDPSDSRAFMFRKDGHLFYHINFYTDNFSLFYDFNTQKFFHASDENLNYFIGNSVSFFNNQYYFVTKNNGNIYSFDTVFTTYDGAEIPRFRSCRNIRDADQCYRIANDVGFTIETGETPYIQQDFGPIYLTAMDGTLLVTTPNDPFQLVTMDGNSLVTINGNNLVTIQTEGNVFENLICVQHDIRNLTPRVDLSISIDGGAVFGSDMPYVLPEIGKRKNRLMWWQLGAYNDLVCLFKFWGIGRFVVTDGVVNVRQ